MLPAVSTAPSASPAATPGVLGVSAAGTLGVTSRAQAAVPRHNFHGDRPPLRP